MIDSVIMMIAGAFTTLVGFRVVGGRAGVNPRLDGWHRRFGRFMKLGGPALIAIGLALLLSSRQQSTAPAQRCLEAARECSQALVAADYPRVVACTHPKVLELVGGSDKMTNLLASGREKMKTDGFDFIAAEVEHPDTLVQGGDDLFAVLPTLIAMKAPDGRLLQKSFLVGVSGDGGKHWRFVDGAGLDAEKVKTVLPNFPTELEIPMKLEPTFVKSTEPSH